MYVLKVESGGGAHFCGNSEPSSGAYKKRYFFEFFEFWKNGGYPSLLTITI